MNLKDAWTQKINVFLKKILNRQQQKTKQKNPKNKLMRASFVTLLYILFKIIGIEGFR